LNVFNDKDAVNLRLSSFKNEKGQTLQPSQITTLWYRVDDVASGTNQVPQTNVAPAEPTDIRISSAENVMIDQTKDSEIVMITVRFEWGTNIGRNKIFLYERRNLRFG